MTVPLLEDGFCRRCHETVTPIRGPGGQPVCPWCDSPVEDAFGHEKRYCPTCDLMVDPANNGACWRCGSRLQRGVPYDPCACERPECNALVHRFDQQGRRVRYVRGHAPRLLEQTSMVPAEPFAEYLERRLKELDVLAALAREHGLARESVVAVLRRDEETVPREIVRRALWIFGQNGKGMPRRPDAPGFFDLYPEDKRSRTCPGCGKGKAPHAEMCKQCRRHQGRGTGHGHMPIRIGEAVLADAYRVYRAEELTFLSLAERYMDRVPHTSAAALATQFSKAFRRKGWPVRRTTRTRKA